MPTFFTTRMVGEPMKFYNGNKNWTDAAKSGTVGPLLLILKVVLAVKLVIKLVVV